MHFKQTRNYELYTPISVGPKSNVKCSDIQGKPAPARSMAWNALFSRTANGLGHRCLHQRTRVRTQTSKENQHQRAPWRGTHSSVVLRMVWVTVVFIFVQINKTKSVGNK